MLFLLSDWLVKQLLLFDMTLYGSVVRDTMAGIDLHKFVDDGGTITCTGPISSMPYLERLLYHCTLSRLIDTNNLSTTTVTYVFDHIDRRVKVRVLYYKCMQKNIPVNNVDVNCLCLSRTGLFLVTPSTFDACIFQSNPSPLLDILEHCRAKEFKMINMTLADPTATAEAKYMIEQGWNMINGAVQATVKTPDDVCSICKNGFAASQSIETRCGHVYHATCWNQYLQSKSRNEIIACPLCRHELLHWEALIPFRI